MIRVKDDYVILVDDNEYTVAIDKRKKDKKGNDLYKFIGYYGTLEGALKGLYSYMIRKGLSTKEFNFDETIGYVTRMHEEMVQMIEKAVKEF